MQATQDYGVWTSTLIDLHNQRGYLEGLLSTTSIKLNALRDKQTRIERALGLNPSPRLKKKQILHNWWRTDKTIKTCENEERTILDCLQVCISNIHTLEAIVFSGDNSSAAAGHSPSASQCSIPMMTMTDIVWNGWTDAGDLTPFRKRREKLTVLNEILPEVCVEEHDIDGLIMQTVSLPPRSGSPPAPLSALPPAPPNTAYRQYQHSALSPEAAPFEPSITHGIHDDDEKPVVELDKLSITGLQAPKQVQKRRFSDAAINHVFQRLSDNRPSVDRTRDSTSWGPDWTFRNNDIAPRDVKVERTNSM
ncbi:uncharacterized protein BDR25DRAFT_233742 [Lindgomyces ingoldianus]|uniref:Uncharacterized protein n=1 Tax=Lindgomyces ingoldianus TaxID=673940 RepID=A0ACB6QNL2_9PLEO|nr:uncharacterized protein BDR25DRAFT_233742 [Lindgomyces ingoldianus]KAF2467705.1 hypothetical protein BDR25DRAFT_233742 [Lindgomyces ingoldianus]